MSAVITKPDEPQQGDPMVLMIERAARDPHMDVEKLERLFALRERMLVASKEHAFNAAMTEAQKEMGPISADATNPQTKSKYATYAKLDRILRPVYTRHGFALSFDEGDSPKPGHVRVICYVSHSAGFTKPYHKDMPADGKGAKGGDVMTLTHASGAAQTYGMRYLLKGIFNVAIGENDNDGNADEEVETIGPGQLAALEQLIDEVRADKPKLCRMLKVGSLSDIRVGAFETVKALIEAKRAR